MVLGCEFTQCPWCISQSRMACNAWYRLRAYFRSSVRSHRNLIIDTLTGLKSDFTQSQIDAIMGSGNERKQQPTSSTRKTAPPPPVDAPNKFPRSGLSHGSYRLHGYRNAEILGHPMGVRQSEKDWIAAWGLRLTFAAD